MREIKFRGKSKMTVEELDSMHFEHDNGWFYGNFIMYGDKPYIVGDLIEVDSEYLVHDFWVPVYPDSVGQYTGLKDKNGTEIYEGDIVEVLEVRNEDDSLYITDIKWEEAAFVMRSSGSDYYDTFLSSWSGNPMETYPLFEIKIIGNIYENPELLEVE